VSNRNSNSPEKPSDERSLYELSLEDTLAQKMRGVPVKTRVPVTGYNPYDAMAPAPADSSTPTRKSTDLRKLSQWIRMQRQVNGLKKPDSEE
jgi:hypothetical protein